MSVKPYWWLRSVAAALLASLPFAVKAVDPRNYAVELKAIVQAAPAQISLQWTVDTSATSYSVYRKAPAGTSWTLMANLGSSALSWSDLAVTNGSSYEYAVTKTTSAGYSGTGYLLSGINAPLVENRGKLVLIVDNTYAAALAGELARLQQDLVGDGWIVLRHDVARSATVSSVKSLIQADYKSDPANVRSVFLFGHVPVPYSGNLNPPPDGHPDHQGAWPADAFYGDMDGVWTDNTVSNTGGSRPANQNVPGDGKFDQSDLPSDIELAVGRVDLANMTCFSNKTPSRSELDLLRAYLDKDHLFRTGGLSVQRRGLIRDTFGDVYGENFASSGWRNSASFFGPENSFAASYNAYFSTLRDNGYLWSYGTGGGSYTSCDGVGSSDDFATTDIKTVFTGFLGSYFGDWDNESAFLRAPLGSGYCLASVWAGRPHWFLHHMALGETIGYSTRISQNNKSGGLYAGQNWGTHRVHTALMGDPTLRLHPVIPPSNFSAAVSSRGISLNWSASSDANIQGYTVYRASSAAGPFTRISGGSLLTTLGMLDASGTSNHFYMLRAVKLESSAGGTYLNPSVGVFAGPQGTPPAPAPTSTATFVAADTPTGGSWKGVYGTQGYNVIGDQLSLPQAVSMVATGNSAWVWNWNTADAAALQRVGDGSRLAACWYTWSQMSLTISATDTNHRRLALYFLDWDAAGRQQVVELLDAQQQVLVSTSLANFQRGTYLIFDVAGTVSVRIRAVAGNAVLSGVFLDPATTGMTQVAAPVINPASGTLTAGQTLSISCGTAGASIRYTTDGTVPTSSSKVYSGPFTLTASTTVSARAFAPGLIDSPVTSGSFTVALSGPTQAKASFIGLDVTRQGTWKGAFGSEGYLIPGDGQLLPKGISAVPAGKSDWVWAYTTTDVRCLERISSSQRHASCAYGAKFEYDLNLADGQTHQVSLYCLDWDRANRAELVEILDYDSKTVLQSFSLTGFGSGTYLSYAVKGHVVVRFTSKAGPNAVLSGLFIDPSPKQL